MFHTVILFRTTQLTSLLINLFLGSCHMNKLGLYYFFPSGISFCYVQVLEGFNLLL